MGGVILEVDLTWMVRVTRGAAAEARRRGAAGETTPPGGVLG